MQRSLCRTCRRPLDLHVEYQGDRVTATTWTHSLRDGQVGHPPDPVADTEISGVSVCDFCGADDPEMVYPAENFEMRTYTVGEMLHTEGSWGGWAACGGCARFIDARNLAALCARAAEAHKDIEVRSAITTGLRPLYREFMRRRLGPAVPILEYRETQP